jgi:beta-lactamase class A
MLDARPVPLRAATLLLALCLALAACGAPSAAAPAATALTVTATPAAPRPSASPIPPTSTPSATPVPTIAEGVFAAGVAVGELPAEEAREALERSLAPLLRPIEVSGAGESLLLRPEDIGLELGLDVMVDAALAAEPGARVPLEVRFDEGQIRRRLSSMAARADEPATLRVITDTEPISRSFALAGGSRIDLEAAVEQIGERLRSVNGSRRVTLVPAPASAEARPTPQQLQEQLVAMAKEWKGVAGIYVYDLASGQEVASLNEGTVFAAASTIKTAIMLNAYVALPKFTARQERALTKMIVESDNLEANLLLAASVGGGGTEEALKGAERMSEMLADLGLKHTYQWVPYEALDYLRLNKLKYRCGPKDPVGPKPYTETGCALRTTAAEMARLYIWIEQCSRGEGPLLEAFAETLSTARCEAMIGRLEKNGDAKRLVAGLPRGTTAAHKSGWIENMQADAGIVRSPGGDYVVAIYLYRPLGGGAPIPDRVMMASIAGFSRLIYTYYNPIASSR